MVDKNKTGFSSNTVYNSRVGIETKMWTWNMEASFKDGKFTDVWHGVKAFFKNTTWKSWTKRSKEMRDKLEYGSWKASQLRKANTLQ